MFDPIDTGNYCDSIRTVIYSLLTDVNNEKTFLQDFTEISASKFIYA